jgi:hypothetical protein
MLSHNGNLDEAVASGALAALVSTLPSCCSHASASDGVLVDACWTLSTLAVSSEAADAAARLGALPSVACILHNGAALTAADPTLSCMA